MYTKLVCKTNNFKLVRPLNMYKPIDVAKSIEIQNDKVILKKLLSKQYEIILKILCFIICIFFILFWILLVVF